MNARSLFSPSAIPKVTPHVVPLKRPQCAKKRKKCFSLITRSWQSSIYNNRSMPEGLILSQTSAFRLLPPFSNHGPIYMLVYRSSPCLKWCQTLRGLHSPGVRKHCQNDLTLLVPEIAYSNGSVSCSIYGYIYISTHFETDPNHDETLTT